MKCEKCESKVIKHGHKLSGQQVYRCTSCGYCFTGSSKRRLDDEAKDKILALLLQGVDKNEVAEQFGIHPRTIYRIIEKKQAE